MRNIYFLCCVALASLCACESETKEEPVSDFSDLVIQIVLTDPELNDRLNPGSPSFLGEEYTQGIEVLYRYKDQKLTLPQLWPLQTNGGAILGEWSTIYPPYMEDNGYGKTDGNTKGYYYIEASPFVTEGNRDIAYTYIQYPDGNEDEIKVQLYRTSSLLLMDQIWINGELVYSMHPQEGSIKHEAVLQPGILSVPRPNAGRRWQADRGSGAARGRHQYHRDQEEMIYREARPPRLGPAEIFKFHLAPNASPI